MASKPKLQSRLLQLYSSGYLDRRSLPTARVGAKEYIYALSTKSIRILEEQGLTGFTRFRPADYKHYSFPFLNHCIELNKLLVAAYTLERFVPVLSLSAMYHDLDLKRTPIRVTVERRLRDGSKVEEKLSLVSDAILDFRMSVEGQEKGQRRVISYEHDMGTVTNPGEFKKKIRAAVPYVLSEDSKSLTGKNIGIVAYATTAGQARLKQMLEWCEQELKQQQQVRESNLYRFMALPQGAYTPQEIFCSPIWFKPYDASPTSLLWKL